ncbi:MAG TPA: hypothetical protein VFQ86_04685 [Arachidicoccus soli]|nr:hypothetical protein [Arachidicoccus soli]
MEDTKSKTREWIWFFVWLAIIVCLLIWLRQWFWLALPGVLTYFVKAMGLIDENQPEDQFY